MTRHTCFGEREEGFHCLYIHTVFVQCDSPPSSGWCCSRTEDDRKHGILKKCQTFNGNGRFTRLIAK